MAYIATNPKTKDCYAICSAEPDFVIDALKEIKQWKQDGAIIELLPADIAKDRFANSLPKQSKQQKLF
jgi:hypothetical protein